MATLNRKGLFATYLRQERTFPGTADSTGLTGRIVKERMLRAGREQCIQPKCDRPDFIGVNAPSGQQDLTEIVMDITRLVQVRQWKCEAAVEKYSWAAAGSGFRMIQCAGQRRRCLGHPAA